MMMLNAILRRALTASACAMALNAGATAQSSDALEARLAALAAMVAELRGELEAARAHSADMGARVIELEARAPAAATAPVTERALRLRRRLP